MQTNVGLKLSCKQLLQNYISYNFRYRIWLDLVPYFFTIFITYYDY